MYFFAGYPAIINNDTSQIVFFIITRLTPSPSIYFLISTVWSFGHRL
jgi:hypothetical protein